MIQVQFAYIARDGVVFFLAMSMPALPPEGTYLELDSAGEVYQVAAVAWSRQEPEKFTVHLTNGAGLLTDRATSEVMAERGWSAA